MNFVVKIQNLSSELLTLHTVESKIFLMNTRKETVTCRQLSQ